MSKLYNEKKKILFIAPDYFGFNEVIYNALSTVQGYETTMILSNGPYIYKNWGERIYNFFLKNFTKKNLKKINRNIDLQRKISNVGAVDICIVNRSDMLQESHLNLINSIAQKSAVIFWDSFDKITGQKETMKFFDFSFSFDQHDVDTWGLHKINNFFFIEKAEEVVPEYDVFFLGAYDDRFEDLVNIMRYVKSLGLKAGSRLYSYYSKPIPEDLRDDIMVTRGIVPFSKSYTFNLNTKVILDLAHSNQRGLSFRPFEAVGLEKKLITTNNNIKNYSFYRPENICVLNDTNNINIDSEFFTSSYLPIPTVVSASYNMANWAQKIVNTIENG